jgi:hypothetical protein
VQPPPEQPTGSAVRVEEPSVSIPSISFSRDATLLAYARSDDWGRGEARYSQLVNAGHRDEVMVLSVPATPQRKS